jgi:hypothetical protein
MPEISPDARMFDLEERQIKAQTWRGGFVIVTADFG